MRIQRSDAVRAKLAELNLQEQDIADAVAWVRQSSGQSPTTAIKTPRKK